MFKTFFITRQPETEVDHELERAMRNIQDRMERMLAAENSKRQRFSRPESVPSYYR
jgi:hypothetical protein